MNGFCSYRLTGKSFNGKFEWTSICGVAITGAMRAFPPTTGDQGWSVHAMVTHSGMTRTREVKHCPMSILAWSQGSLALSGQAGPHNNHRWWISHDQSHGSLSHQTKHRLTWRMAQPSRRLLAPHHSLSAGASWNPRGPEGQGEQQHNRFQL
jgi:hypothetical protein